MAKKTVSQTTKVDLPYVGKGSAKPKENSKRKGGKRY